MLLKTIIIKLLKNLIAMLAGKEVIFWCMELVAKQTDNKLDDNAIPLLEALYDGDQEKFQYFCEELVAEWNKTKLPK